MKKVNYLVFTNIWKGYRKFKMSNCYKVFHATTLDEVKEIATKIEGEGYKVLKVTTNLGNAVAI